MYYLKYKIGLKHSASEVQKLYLQLHTSVTEDSE